MKKILVLGSNSFSGSTFIRYAIENSYEVIGVSRSPEPDAIFLPHRWLDAKLLKNYRFYQADLNHNLKDIISLTKENAPEYVVNFAAQSMVAESWIHPEDWMMTNVVATIKFHDQLRQCSFLKKYVHISTPEVYGSCKGIIPANTSYHPSTPYAVSRAASDMWLSALHANYQFPVVFTRAANVYGPGQQLYRIIPKTILNIRLGKKLELHGGGQSIRSFIHILDVADGTLRILTNANAGEIYHFSTERNISIRKLVQLICQKMQVDFNEIVTIGPERQGKDAAYLLDSKTSHHNLGWKVTISLEEGIDQAIGWVDKHFDKLKSMQTSYNHKP